MQRDNNRSFIRWRWHIVASLYLGSICYLLFQGGRTAVMLLVILTALILYLILGKWSGIRSVQGERKLGQFGNADGQAISGTSAEVSLSVHVPGYYPLPYILVRDRLFRHDGQSIPFETSFVPNWKRFGEVRYTTPPLKRGLYRFGPTECSTRDVFGMFEHSGSFETGTSFSVVPQTVPLRGWHQIRRGMRGPHSHASAPRAAKETTQINGVREYLYGDKLSRVHWNATAKTGEWKSKAFERESLPRTIVVLDRSTEAYGIRQERFELAVSVAASLIELGMRRETAMGLVSAGEHTAVLAPRSGADHRAGMIRHLTVVEPDASQSLYASLQRLESVWEPGTLVVFVSGAQGDSVMRAMSWLSRKGVSLSYIGIEDADLRGGRMIKAAWLQALRAKGWSAYSVRQLQDLPAVLEGGAS
ncbi:DUF58 domain-containing protein [Paenibacillus sp. MMS18-CY102]|uniref:DUF58 domain-containing protein n=1 Tax=Paenibacillus sp. MMS18-CY102 TaxID=2682849 RepID=UPI001365C6A8|nr:DUF58 domain-containing protein [Paenibacillus sp. MMS18-CY102]MWC27556.1 DUF58 domain-containing protein [Paenibacillus sp. MMS18-CY102]